MTDGKNALYIVPQNIFLHRDLLISHFKGCFEEEFNLANFGRTTRRITSIKTTGKIGDSHLSMIVQTPEVLSAFLHILDNDVSSRRYAESLLSSSHRFL